MKDEIYLKSNNLSFGYKKRPLVLKDVNFSVCKGERVLILSSSEMGKTTFLSVLSSYNSNYSGEILLNGQELKSISDDEKCFSFLPNEPIFFNNKTILQNINYMRKIKKMQNIDENELDLYFFKKNFNKKANDKVKTLSVYEKRVLSFFRCLIKNPDCIFIDDMFASLGNDEIEKMANFYIKEFKNFNKNVFFAIGEQTYKNCKNIIQKLNFDRIFYLFDARVVEFSNLDEFENNIINLNQLLYFDNKNYIRGSILKQDDIYYFEQGKDLFELNDLKEEILIKINNLNLDNYDTEEVFIALKDNNFDEFKLENIQKYLNDDKLMVFSNLDGNRII